MYKFFPLSLLTLFFHLRRFCLPDQDSFSVKFVSFFLPFLLFPSYLFSSSIVLFVSNEVVEVECTKIRHLIRFQIEFRMGFFDRIQGKKKELKSSLKAKTEMELRKKAHNNNVHSLITRMNRHTHTHDIMCTQ